MPSDPFSENAAQVLRQMIATTSAHQNQTSQELSPPSNQVSAKAIIAAPTTIPDTAIGLLGLYRYMLLAYSPASVAHVRRSPDSRSPPAYTLPARHLSCSSMARWVFLRADGRCVHCVVLMWIFSLNCMLGITE